MTQALRKIISIYHSYIVSFVLYRSYIYKYIYLFVYMLAIAIQTAGPNGLNSFEETHG